MFESVKDYLFSKVVRYDPSKVTIVIGDVIVTGFSDGDFVKISRNADSYNYIQGVDGLGAREKILNKSGVIEITLMQGSSAISQISKMLNTDSNDDEGDKLINIAIHNPGTGKESILAPWAWLKKVPDITYGKEVGERTFLFECNSIKFSLDDDSLVGYFGGLF